MLLLTYRYLDPVTGRFLTRDPIGMEGGVNLYAYVANGVVMEIDQWGLLPKGIPNPPRRLPIPTPRDPIYRQLWRLVKVLCALDCVVAGINLIDTIANCLSKSNGENFACCLLRGIHRVPNIINSGCTSCILAALCNWSIPGVGAMCGILGDKAFSAIEDILEYECKKPSPSCTGVGGGGQGGCLGPAYHCYPAY